MMHPPLARLILCLAIPWLAILLPASSALAATVRVLVQVPADTPADETLFLAGSSSAAGNWRADGVPLDRRADGKYEVAIALDAGQVLEFKITRGTWETVERAANGADRPNRVIDAEDLDPADPVVEITVERWSTSADAAPRQSTVTGTLRLHDLPSELAGGARTVRVWLPPDYDPARVYPVLYLHDGQNVFDAATSAFGAEWQVDETLTRLVAAGEVEPMIVVGIDNGGVHRLAELTHVPDPDHGGGGAARYEAFLLDTVMPFVQRTYNADRAAPATYLGGSSLGGLVTLEIVRRHPRVFDGAIVMSPSAWWAGEALAQELDAGVGGLAGVRVWLDIGAAEKPEVVQRVSTVLGKAGVEHRFVVDEKNVDHNEAAWSARFADAVRYVTGR